MYPTVKSLVSDLIPPASIVLIKLVSLKFKLLIILEIQLKFL